MYIQNKLGNKIYFYNKESIPKTLRTYDEKFTILFNMTEKNMRIYGPEIMIMCNALTDIHFHINIVGDYSAAEDTIKDVLKLNESIYNFRQNNRNIPTFSIEVGIKKSKGFFVSKYININYFMDLFKTDIYVLSEDNIFVNSIYRFLDEYKKYDITLPANNTSLDNNTRVFTDYAYFNNNSQCIKFLSIIEAYIINNCKNDLSNYEIDELAVNYGLKYILENKISIKFNLIDFTRITHKTVNIKNIYKDILEDM